MDRSAVQRIVVDRSAVQRIVVDRSAVQRWIDGAIHDNRRPA